MLNLFSENALAYHPSFLSNNIVRHYVPASSIDQSPERELETSIPAKRKHTREGKDCYICNTSKSPQWRYSGTIKNERLCNTCGIHWMKFKKNPAKESGEQKDLGASQTVQKTAIDVESLWAEWLILHPPKKMKMDQV